MSAIIRTLKTNKNGIKQDVLPITVLDAVVDPDTNQSLDAILDKKPENVSELFNFNKYNGDISTLEVGMYVYLKNYATIYSSPNVTTAIGAFSEGWCKINTVYPEYNSCYVLQTQLFGKQGTSTYTTAQYIKAEDILFILTSDEAKYLGMLSSVWGATQGGLIKSYAENTTLCTRKTSPSFTIPKNGSSMLITAFRYGSAQMASWVFMSDGPSGSVVYKELFNDGLSLSVSGNTGTISNDGITIEAIYF